MSIFKTDAEKLRSRREYLESAAHQADADAETATRVAAEVDAEADARLTEGLSVADWQRRREAAEEKASKAKRDAAAHRSALAVVEAKLTTAEATERKVELLAALSAAADDADQAAEELRSLAPGFASAWAKLDGARARYSAVQGNLREAGIPSRNQDPENGFDHPELSYPAEAVAKAAILEAFPDARHIGPLLFFVPA